MSPITKSIVLYAQSMKVTNMAGTVIYEDSLYGNLYVIPICHV